MLQNELEKVGLNIKETQVYLGLLELGDANIVDLAKKSGVKRTTIYDVLASLRDKGLIGLTKKKNRTLYFAESPAKLADQIEERRNIISRIMPELLSVANRLEKKPKIRFFEGVEGVKEVYKDTIKYPEQEILAWATHEAAKYFDIEYLWHDYVPARLKNKIWERVIAPENPAMLNLKSYDEKHLRQIRLVREKDLLFEVEINLYGGKNIGIMSFREQIGLIIESKKMFNTLRSIFEMNWQALSGG